MNRKMIVWLSMVAPLAVWAQQPVVDTSGWECKYCLDTSGWHGMVEPQVGWLSDGDPDFGRYSGLDEDGAYFNLQGELIYRNADGHSWMIRGDDLGLDGRMLSVDGGTQGLYRLRVGYDELHRLGAEGAQSPYRGLGGSDLTLPAGWVDGGTVAGMSGLASAQQSVNLDRERVRLSADLDLVASANWEYGITVAREEREGLQPLGGSFFFNSAQLGAPIDSTTDTLGAYVSFTGERGALELRYQVSLFDSDHEVLRWENPYSELAGESEGELALAPDNQYHLLQVSGNYRLGATGQLFGNLGLGRATQDEAFLDATTNSGLNTSALPASSLNGEVETLNATLRFTARPQRGMSLLAELRQVERDNQSDRHSYTRVLADAFVGASRDNPRYSFTDRDVRLQVRQRVDSDLALALGVDREMRERTEQAVSETDETSLWAGVDYQFTSTLRGGVRMTRAQRYVTAASSAPVVVPADNPLMSKYNLADRERRALDVNLGWDASDAISLTFDASERADDYDESELGLNAARDRYFGVGLNVALTSETMLYAQLSREVMRSDQTGSEAGVNWQLRERDASESVAVGLRYRQAKSSTEFGFDYTLTDADGEIDIRQSGGADALPDLNYRLHQMRLYGVMPWRKLFDLTAELVYQGIDVDDWSSDGVASDTVPNLLGFGAEAEDASVTALVLGMRYRF